jgi:UDP-N-acetylglucosamine 1-carboxyvinyltransferase
MNFENNGPMLGELYNLPYNHTRSQERIMEKFIIEGGIPLRGDVTPSGNKNAALPILAACILTDETVVLHNVPQIRDVIDMRRLLESSGVQVDTVNENTWHLTAHNLHVADLDPDMCRRIRASILLAGPMLARTGELQIPPPGGDVIGRRRLDTHILALKALGAQASYERMLKFKTDKLIGTDILLDEASVTATENVIMAAVTAKGKTTIRNAASEPHVQELCHFLNSMGAKIMDAGSNTLHIEGVDQLHGTEHTIGSDLLEVISFVGAAVVTKGQIRIRNADVQHLEMVSHVFRRMGIVWDVDGNDLLVPETQPRNIISDLDGAVPEIKTNVWPAFPTDLISIAITVATQMNGSILFHDWMFSGRMYFTDKLVGMGARIILCDPYRCLVQGPSTLYAEKLESPDIRAGMALLLATLAAKGESTIRNVRQIDRGYERVDDKLRLLGAQIERVEE